MEADAALDELLAVHGGVLDVPPTWNQGRGAFGGFLCGAMVRALEDSEPERPLRSLTAELVGPVPPGAARVTLEVLRRGNAVTTTAVRLLGDDGVNAHGVGVLGKARAYERTAPPALAAPALPPWESVPVLEIPAAVQAAGPAFARHFEMRVVSGFPFGSVGAAEVLGYVRPLRPGTRRDSAFLAACIDVYYPALFAETGRFRPMATIAFSFQPLAPPPPGDEPLAYRARLIAGAGGYLAETRELWSGAGQLLALNQQTFVVIK
jgi:hypothetical protein